MQCSSQKWNNRGILASNRYEQESIDKNKNKAYLLA